jgi:hypothetical protein
VLALAFYLFGGYVVHLQFRRQAHTPLRLEIALTLGLFFVSPAGSARCAARRVQASRSS